MTRITFNRFSGFSYVSLETYNLSLDSFEKRKNQMNWGLFVDTIVVRLRIKVKRLSIF